MRKLFIVAALSCVAFTAQCQYWTQPQGIYTGSKTEVTLSFKMGKTCEAYSFYKIYNAKSAPDCAIRFKFDYYDCNGKVKTETPLITLGKQGEIADPGAWFSGRSIVRACYDVKFIDNCR